MLKLVKSQFLHRERYSVTVKFLLCSLHKIVSYIIYIFIYILYKGIFLHIQVSYFQL